MGAQQLLDHLEATVAPPPPDETRFYGWQPLPLIDFHQGMEIVGVGGDRSFLDVGSGIGCKLFLAAQLGWSVAGIERHEPYIEASRRLFPDFPVTLADAFAFDRYAEFDLIYCYRPCINPDEQTRLNHAISDRMAAGALFFSAGGPYPDWLEPVGDQVWRA